MAHVALRTSIVRLKVAALKMFDDLMAVIWLEASSVTLDVEFASQ